MPVDGKYFDNLSPINRKHFCKIAQLSVLDIDLALDTAHNAFKAWKKTSVTERSNILLKIADRIDENLEVIAVVETWNNGKPVRRHSSYCRSFSLFHQVQQR